MTDRFQSSDAWIFISLSPAETGTTLDSLIATADWINHAIPTQDEIEGAVNRLAQAGLLHMEADNFFMTEQGIELYRAIMDKKGAILKHWMKMEKLLNETDLPVLVTEEFHLPSNQLEDAYQRYIKRFSPNLNKK
jgi:hypothetical protein